MDFWNNSEFKENILQQAKNKKMLLTKDYPFEIILNSFWFDVFNELLLESTKRKKETWKLVKTNLEINNLLISKNITIGDKKRVRGELLLFKWDNNTQKVIGTIHTHLKNSPFSFYDFSNLFFSYRHLMSFLVDNKKNVLLTIRTKETKKYRGNQKSFVNHYDQKYDSLWTSYKGALIANLLFCQEHHLVFYAGKLPISHFSKKEIHLFKKRLIKKN